MSKLVLGNGTITTLLFSLPDMKLITTIKSADLKDNTSQFTNITQRYIITEITNPDSIVTVYDEKLTKLKTVKIIKPNYIINNAEVVEQPDKSFVVVVSMYHKTTFARAIRIIYPNNSIQELDGFNTFLVSEERDLEDRIVFRKTNSDASKDFAIYSFGNLSATNESLALEGVQVYPNPNEGIFNVKIEGTGNYELRLLDILGKTYWQTSTEGANTIEINALQQASNGIYLLEVKDEQGKRTIQRLVKQ